MGWWGELGATLLMKVCFGERGWQRWNLHQCEECEISASEETDQNSLLRANSAK